MIAGPRLLRFARGEDRVDAYANLYRVGDVSTAGPLVVYVGGAVGVPTYVERMSTEPVVLRDVLADALARSAAPRLDVLFCPCPVDTRRRGETKAAGCEWFETHLDDELIPSLGVAPTALSFIGYSAGAIFAAHLAIVTEASALVTIGGAGLVRALSNPELTALRRENQNGGWRLRAALFRNMGDHADEPADAARLLGVPGAAMPARPGGHPFVDYIDNGTAAEAFRFAIDAVIHE